MPISSLYNKTLYWKPHPDVVEMSLQFCLENQRPGLKILINLRLKVRCVQFLMLINVVAVTFQLMWMTCNTSLSHAGMVFRLDTRTGHWLEEKLSNIFSVTKIFYFYSSGTSSLNMMTWSRWCETVKYYKSFTSVGMLRPTTFINIKYEHNAFQNQN